MIVSLSYRCASVLVSGAALGWAGLSIANDSLAQQSTSASRSRYEPDVPRTWADEDVATFELPLARPEYSPVHVSEDFYDKLPVRTIWKSYPIYHPDHEPPGYREQLAALEPQVLFDESDFETEEDWVEAGAHVFRAPIHYDGGAARAGDVLDPHWYKANGIGLTAEGVIPYVQWVIREKGKLEVGNFSCAMCHTRLMPDGSVVEGAQGNFPFDRIIANRIKSGQVPLAAVRTFTRLLADVPWVHTSPYSQMSAEELVDVREAIPPGVMHRQGTAYNAPARVPDLIGIRDRKYLDATGLVRHRSIGDLMRYAASNQGLDLLARFGDFAPSDFAAQLPPRLRTLPGTASRYSDAQLFALAKFLYSLDPPPNPNRFDELARRGARVFRSENCAKCHTPPLYTNNLLIPVSGFDPPANHIDKFDVSPYRVGTDPKLAMTTRRGTGYYKVPSLKGLWYRGPLGHSGSIGTLKDWFDSARLRDDYIPTGFAGVDCPRPVPGHTHGLQLSAEDKRALIAFLRTL